MDTQTQISVRIEQSSLDQLDALGKLNDRSRSYYIRMAIKEFIKSNKSKPARRIKRRK